METSKVEDMNKYIQMGLFLIGVLVAIESPAQKKPYLSEKEQIIEMAYKTLDASLQDGSLKEFGAENEISGSYTFDLTIRNKGEVATVMAIERDGEVSHQNRLKNYLKEYRFPFKMPKDKSYKFRYQFKF